MSPKPCCFFLPDLLGICRHRTWDGSPGKVGTVWEITGSPVYFLPTHEAFASDRFSIYICNRFVSFLLTVPHRHENEAAALNVENQAAALNVVNLHLSTWTLGTQGNEQNQIAIRRPWECTYYYNVHIEEIVKNWSCLLFPTLCWLLRTGFSFWR